MRKDSRKIKLERSGEKRHMCFNCKTSFLPVRQPLCYKCRTSLADDFFINLNFVYALSLVGIIANLYLLFPATMGTLADILDLKDLRTIGILQWFALIILVLMLVLTSINFYKIRRISFHRDNLRFMGFYTSLLLFCFGLVYLVHIPLDFSLNAIVGTSALALSIIFGIIIRKYLSRLNKIFLSSFVLSVLLLTIVLVRAGMGMGHLGTNWFFQLPGLSIIGLAGLMISIVLISLRMDLISKTFGFYSLWTLALSSITVTFVFFKLFSERITISNEIIIFVIGISTLLLIISLAHYAIKKRIDMRVKENLEAIKHQIDESYKFIDEGEYFYALNSINTSIELNPLHGIDNPLRKSLLKWMDEASKYSSTSDEEPDSLQNDDIFVTLKKIGVHEKKTIPETMKSDDGTDAHFVPQTSKGSAAPSAGVLTDDPFPDFKGSEQVWIKKGEMATVKGDITKAIECYENGIRANPRFSETWLELGNLFASREGISSNVRDCYERVLELKAEPIKSWIGYRIPLRYISWLIVSYLFYEISLYKKGMILGSVRDQGLSEGEHLYGRRAYTPIIGKNSIQNETMCKDTVFLKSEIDGIKRGRYSALSSDDDFRLESRRYAGAPGILPRGGALDSFYRLLAEQNIADHMDETNVGFGQTKTKNGQDQDERVKWDEREKAKTVSKVTEKRKAKGGDDGIENEGSTGKARRKKKKKRKKEVKRRRAKKGMDTKEKERATDEVKRKEFFREREGAEGKVTEEHEDEEEWAIPEKMEDGGESKGGEVKEITAGEAKRGFPPRDREGTDETVAEELEEEKEWIIPKKVEDSVVSPEITEVIKHEATEESPLDEIMNFLSDVADEDEGEAE